MLRTTSSFVMVLAVAGSAQAATRSVNQSGTDSGDCVASPCATIAYAISQAAAGDVVSIASDTDPYNINIGDLPLTLPSNVTVRGASAAGTILAITPTTGGTAAHAFEIDAGGVYTFENLTLNNPRGPAIRLDYTGTTATALTLNGIEVVNAGSNNGGDGVFIRTRGNLTLTVDNTLLDNASDNGLELSNIGSGPISVAFDGLTARDNSDHGVQIQNGGSALTLDLANTDLINNGENGFSYNQSNAASLPNLVALVSGNSFDGNNTTGLRFDTSEGRIELTASNNSFEANDTYGLYVGAWEGGEGILTIDANTMSNNGSEGLYLGASESGSFIDASIRNNVIDSNNSNGFYGYVEDTGGMSLLFESNVITNNNGEGAYINLSYARGGVTFRDNDVDNNDGIGIDVRLQYGVYDSLLLENNRVSNNESSGVYLEGRYGSSIDGVIVRNNEIRSNDSYGFYFYVDDSAYADVSVTNNVISHNDNQSIYMDGDGGWAGKVDITDNELSGESSNGGVYFSNQYGQSDVLIARNQITNANTGIYASLQQSDGSFDIVDNVIESCNQYGVYAYLYGGNYDHAIIDNNAIRGAQSSGIYLSGGYGGADSRISRNTVTNGDSIGFYFYASNYWSGDVTVVDNEFSFNSQTGAYFSTGGGSSHGRILFADNDVSNNGDYGIYTDFETNDVIWDIDIVGNRVHDNAYSGGYFESGRGLVSHDVRYNDFIGNGGNGIYAYSGGSYGISDWVIAGNYVEGNAQDAISLDFDNWEHQRQALITHNVISALSTRYAINMSECTSNIVVDARDNWFGTDDAAEIEDLVNHKPDDGNYGRALLAPATNAFAIAISPASAPETGNVPVLITATERSSGFLGRDGVQISIGGNPVTAWEPGAQFNQIIALAPPHARGFVDVTVTNSDGRTATLVGGFEYTAASSDGDADGVIDSFDNCPTVGNLLQTDTDNDGDGDPCDTDDDQDGVADAADNCPLVANADQTNSDPDGVGDACDGDADADGIPNGLDRCPFVADRDQYDNDRDLEGDACDTDDDNDGVADVDDNCNFAKNTVQSDADFDGIGDACDSDADGDGTIDQAPGGGEEAPQVFISDTGCAATPGASFLIALLVPALRVLRRRRRS